MGLCQSAAHGLRTTVLRCLDTVPWTRLWWTKRVFSLCSSEKLEGEKLNVAEVTQSEIAQKQKLQTVLERINDSLKLSTRNIRWNVDCKNHCHQCCCLSRRWSCFGLCVTSLISLFIYFFSSLLAVHAKSIVAILHLLVALSQHFRAPIRLPDHVSIQVVVVQKREGILQSRQIQEEITGNTE